MPCSTACRRGSRSKAEPRLLGELLVQHLPIALVRDELGQFARFLQLCACGSCLTGRRESPSQGLAGERFVPVAHLLAVRLDEFETASRVLQSDLDASDP